MLTLPVIGRRKKQPYLAIRSMLTMRQIKKQGPLFLSEVKAFMDRRGLEAAGPAFYRTNCIGTDGQLEMEFGYFTLKTCAGAGPVRSGTMPSGRYGSVSWHGAHDRLADVTAMLTGWARETGVAWDVTDTPRGAIFAGRFEIYHDNPSGEQGSDKRFTEVAIKVRPTTQDE